MARLILLLLVPLVLQAQGFGPWASRESAPSWWLALHGEYVAVSTMLAQVPIPATLQSPTVSFSPQGLATLKAMAGRNIQGVGIYDLVVCSPLQLPVSAGSVYQTAVSAGISPLGPGEAKVLLTQVASRSKGALFLEIAADASIALPVLGQSGLVSMSNKYVVGLLAGHVLFDNVQNQVRSHLPDPSSVIDILLDPSAMLTFSGGGCKEATMVARFAGRAQVSGTFPIH